MTAPYDQAAAAYAGGYLWPIPVFGKNQPVGGATGYEGTVTPEKIAAWLDPDPRVRARAGRGHRLDNTALRHSNSLAIDVDQGYGAKSGVAQLARFADERGLPPLPATWSSTARGDDSPSRQYVYRIPEDRPMKTKPCPAVELCNWHHRYTVCAPSIHPDTGAAYAWYLPGADGVPPTWGDRTEQFPRLDSFTYLPIEWLAVFATGVTVNADRTVDVVDIEDLVATFPKGNPDKLVQHLIAKWSDDRQHVGHDEFKSAAIHALLLGREDHTGVRDLMVVLYRRLLTYLRDTRPQVADREAKSLLNAAGVIAQQKPTSTPDPVDDDTWQAFLATFTADPAPRMADNRAGWMRDALTTRPDTLRTYLFHATKAFSEVIQGRYSATRAVTTLTASAPHGAADTHLRVALAGALSNLEGAAR